MKKIKTKSTIFLISILFLLSGVLIVPNVMPKQAPKTSQIENMNIVVTGEQAAAVQAAIDEYWEDSPYSNGIAEPTVDASGETEGGQLQYVSSRLAAQSADIEVIGMDVIWTAQFVESGWLKNLSALLEPNELDGYVTGMVDSCVYAGDIWAYPYFFNLGLLYYRKDLTSAAGYNTTDFDTWPELKNVANEILEEEDNETLAGFIGQFDDYEGGTVNFQEWCGSNGATSLMVEGTDFTNFDENVVEAMTFLKGLVPPSGETDLIDTDYIIPREALNYKEGESGNKWLAGEAIFCRQWPYIYGLSIADETLNATDGSGNYTQIGIMPLPTFNNAPGERSSCVGGQILGINGFITDDDRIQAALNITRFLCANESQYIALEEFAHPPALLETYNTVPDEMSWILDLKPGFDKTLARPKHPSYTSISEVIYTEFNNILSCDKEVKAGLLDMQLGISSALKGAPEIIPGFNVTLVLLLVAAMASLIILLKRKKIMK